MFYKLIADINRAQSTEDLLFLSASLAPARKRGVITIDEHARALIFIGEKLKENY